MTIQSPRAIDQVPSSLREAINQLFATRTWPTSKCDQMLEHLLRYACVEYQIVEQHNWHARIVIHNLLKTYYADCEMQEICCYQTLHIFVRLLCTLGILKKQECSGQPTTYLLPLDLGYCFQVSTVVLAEVDRLCNPEYTKNLKMRKKAQQVKERLLLMNPVLQSMQQRYENVGDSAREESPRREILEDSSSDVLGKESTANSWLGDSIVVLPKRRSSSFEHEKREKQPESPKEDKNLPDVAPSSIEFLSLDRDSLGKELELESPMDNPWTGSEEELAQEAVRYLKLLDGPEYATPDYVNTHAGKKALGGYKNKIRRSPRLARVAAINTLLHRTFYDLTSQKKPLENAGKWFHSSFDRYADQQRPMEITGEILDWAKSSYALEEIASVLLQERKRQETQWWSPESPHLPFSSCVVTHQYLRDDASALRISVPEQQQNLLLAETARQGTGFQWMSRTEAEQLVDEIRREASWYLDEIHVYPAPQLGENAYVVQASITEIPFPVVYALRQDWWLHHQEQLRYQVRKEQRKDKKRARGNERGFE